MDSQHLTYPRVPCFWLMDSLRIMIDALVFLRAGAAGPCRVYDWSRDNSKELGNGWIISGKTVRELARKLELPPDNLEKTIEIYNRYCEKGKDPDFGRKKEGLVPLDAPPYYAVRLWPGGPNTQGGPKRNAKCEILNINGDPIPGLYGGGEMGSMFGMLYPGGGSNLAECLAMGRVAGENVAHARRK